MSYPRMDPAKLDVFPLATRRNLLSLDALRQDPSAPPPELGPALAEKIHHLSERVIGARARGAAVMLGYGAHLVKNGAGPLVNALIEEGYLTHLATQGAGIIHDWEFAFQGASGESVRENAPVGRFGAWEETGRWINLAVLTGAAEGLGFGEAMGRLIEEDGLQMPSAASLREQIAADPADPLSGAKADLLWTIERFSLKPGRQTVAHPHKEVSIPACAYRNRVPFTVHPGIGYDIIVNHPWYPGGAIGRASQTDAQIFTRSVDQLEGGVYMSVGSAIMSPQVFEKAFSAANNLRHREGRPFLKDHYLAIVDIQDGGGWDWASGEPPSDHPAYYLRYCNSFYRMGGTLDYLLCDNRVFLAGLLAALRRQKHAG